jgi:hypothetical protein
LRFGIPLFSRLTIPNHRLNIVLRDTPATTSL